MSTFDDKFCEEVYNKLKERINAAIYIRNNAADHRLSIKITKKGLIYEVYYKYNDKMTDDIVQSIVHSYKGFILSVFFNRI